MTRIALLQRALQRAITESHQSTANVAAAEARLNRARRAEARLNRARRAEARLNRALRAEYRAAEADRDARRASTTGAVGGGATGKLLEELYELRKLASGLQLAHDGQDGNPITREVVERTLERFVGPKVVYDHVAEHCCCCPAVGNGKFSPGVGGHSNLLALHGLVTRYVTGALLASRRWLHRKGWVRRAAVSSPRPSDTTTGGDAA